MSLSLCAIIYLVLNLISFCAYGWDKHKAVKDKWRVMERTLLILGFLGPWGALCGMYLFHHKTHKPVFKLNFLFLAIHLILLFLYFGGYVE